MTTPDLTTEEAKDLIDSVPDPECTYGVKPGAPKTCTNPAEWALVLACGHIGYLCRQHHDLVVISLFTATSVSCSNRETPPAPHPAYLRVTFEWVRL